MAQPTHKSATSVTLAPLEEKSAFERFVQKYWVHAAVIAALISAYVIYRTQQGQVEKQVRDQSWDALNSRTTPEGFPAIPAAAPAVFDALATELKDKPVAPWARWLEANSQASKRQYAEARATLDRLRVEHPTHTLVAERWNFGGAAPESMVDYFSRALEARATWEQQHPTLFANPPIPADAVRVRLKTDLGDIVLALYPSSAPKHVESFLANLDSGYYTGTKFYRVDPQGAIDAGDPNSVAGDPATWGQGGKDKILPYVETNLYHFEGAVSALNGAAPGESLGSLFSIMTADRHEFDGTRVVFGVVESGIEIARQIAAAEVEEGSDGRPKQPVTITALERL